MISSGNESECDMFPPPPTYQTGQATSKATSVAGIYARKYKLYYDEIKYSRGIS